MRVDGWVQLGTVRGAPPQEPGTRVLVAIGTRCSPQDMAKVKQCARAFLDSLQGQGRNVQIMAFREQRAVGGAPDPEASPITTSVSALDFYITNIFNTNPPKKAGGGLFGSAQASADPVTLQRPLRRAVELSQTRAIERLVIFSAMDPIGEPVEWLDQNVLLANSLVDFNVPIDIFTKTASTPYLKAGCNVDALTTNFNPTPPFDLEMWVSMQERFYCFREPVYCKLVIRANRHIADGEFELVLKGTPYFDLSAGAVPKTANGDVKHIHLFLNPTNKECSDDEALEMLPPLIRMELFRWRGKRKGKVPHNTLGFNMEVRFFLHEIYMAERTNVLIIGKQGSGKSSFVNSSTFLVNENYKQPAYTASSSHHVTQSLAPFAVEENMKLTNIPFIFWDTVGINKFNYGGDEIELMLTKRMPLCHWEYIVKGSITNHDPIRKEHVEVYRRNNPQQEVIDSEISAVVLVIDVVTLGDEIMVNKFLLICNQILILNRFPIVVFSNMDRVDRHDRPEFLHSVGRQFREKGCIVLPLINYHDDSGSKVRQRNFEIDYMVAQIWLAVRNSSEDYFTRTYGANNNGRDKKGNYILGTGEPMGPPGRNGTVSNAPPAKSAYFREPNRRHPDEDDVFDDNAARYHNPNPDMFKNEDDDDLEEVLAQIAEFEAKAAAEKEAKEAEKRRQKELDDELNSVEWRLQALEAAERELGLIADGDEVVITGTLPVNGGDADGGEDEDGNPLPPTRGAQGRATRPVNTYAVDENGKPNFYFPRHPKKKVPEPPNIPSAWISDPAAAPPDSNRPSAWLGNQTPTALGQSIKERQKIEKRQWDAKEALNAARRFEMKQVQEKAKRELAQKKKAVEARQLLEHLKSAGVPLITEDSQMDESKLAETNPFFKKRDVEKEDEYHFSLMPKNGTWADEFRVVKKADPEADVFGAVRDVKPITEEDLDPKNPFARVRWD